MRISKTRFINYIRCKRYAALDEIHNEKKKAIVVIDDEIVDLMNEEDRYKFNSIYETIYDEEDEDLTVKVDKQMEVMLEYYNKIEELTAKSVISRFKGNVIYSLETYKQKKFEAEVKDGFRFYCFLDGYQEDEKNVRIFETKATTSKKFLDMKYKDDEGNTSSIFEHSPDNILMLKKDLGFNTNEHYAKKESRLKERLSKEGRYVYDLAYQRYVIEKNNTTDNKKYSYYLVVLNSEYVHKGIVDDNNKPIYEDDIITMIDLTRITEEMLPIIDNDAKWVVESIDNMSADKVNLGKFCQRKDTRQCKYYQTCYSHIPDKNSIFVYLNGHTGFKDETGEKRDRFDLINEGYINALDIPNGWLERHNNVIQREVIETKIPFYEKAKIKDGIQVLKYPIYHLDFETFPCPLPRFRGEKPYSQSLFQYSIHVEREAGICDKEKDNYSFVAYTHDDLREELVKNMIDIIKSDNGSILVYNQSFEQTRLKEMAIVFPKYQERLLNMVDRLFDLMDLVRGNKKLYESIGYSKEESAGINYYHDNLNGSYSIKKVLPLFSNLKYQGMDIANGTDALVTYANFPKMTKEEFDKNYKDLLDYCKQDTWAMVLILNELRKIV